MSTSKIKNRLVIKEMNKEEHLSQFNNLLRYAFQVTNRELLDVGWEEDEIKQSKSPVLEKADVIGWFDGDKLASQIAVYPMKVNIHGEIYEMGGVTGVATYPEYANMGLMHTLIKRSLIEMRRRGQTVSFLFPYSIPYYRRKGWEIISDKMTFTIKDTQLPHQVEVPGMMDRVSIEHEDIKKVYDRFSAKRHGTLQRDELAWEEYWRWEPEEMIAAVYYSEDHDPMGFVLYWIENEIFHIKEIVYLNQEARHGVWNYISAHFSMITEVQGNNFTNESLAFLLEDSEITETICPFFMARIVDLRGFIRQYPFSVRDKKNSLCLVIDDPMAKWNCGAFTLTWDERGRTKFKAGESDENRVECNIQTLTTMLLSYRRPSYLHRIERLRADPATIQLLETLIPLEQPYYSDYF
ncbi:MAG: GNAT family N-acetyltransferase [Clostridiales bacterium]|uniref:Acetyltransferase n=1 Tax=Harryflintia acetispora TaxID=1849041 RepID=A0A9X8UIY4_9FIRM|nr:MULTISPECIES: GNAT family N-acetyltransferase [Oscillospiraceae]PWM40359.1 MAG: GNAT family N-acetyltransferase [Clostridiales bacterium]RGB67261.1 GNAT family N-acetyltransferase [Harryflintia acetispora]TCL43176.1 putative acetyltransferase [Harryflintia acetispora]